MNNNGFTLIELIIVLAFLVMLVLCGLTGTEKKREAGDVNCEHSFVVTSRYVPFVGKYETFSRCSKCGKEI